MTTQLATLLPKVSEAPATPPIGWFRYLHNSFLGRYRHMAWVEVPLADEWGAIATIVQNDPGSVSSELIDQAERHAWAVGRHQLWPLVDLLWPRLTPVARTKVLAGESEFLKADGVAARIHARIENGTFDADSALEIGCNSIYYGRAGLVEKVLDISRSHLELHMDRIGPLGDEGERWRKHLEPLSDRLIDLWFEAAVRSGNDAAIRLCLREGANPNIPIWRLERSFNERNSVLTCLLKEAANRDSSIGEPVKCLIETLLDAGADPQGIDYEGRNRTLATVLSWKTGGIADLLLDRGARFEGGNLRAPQQTAGCESTIVSPRPSLRIPRDEYDWAYETLGPWIDFAEIESVPYFYNGNAQGGDYRTFIESFFYEDDLEALRHFESRGLSTVLTIPILLSAIDAGAYHCLRYLLNQAREPEQALKRVLEHQPDFATHGLQYLCRAEADGCNVIPDFNTYGQTPIQMPDGTRFYAYLDAIAPPGHDHGPVPEGNIFVEVIDAEHRREGDILVTTKLRRRWRLVPIPGTDRMRIESAALIDVLPVVKELDGQFFWIGTNVGGFAWTKLPEAWRQVVRDWEEGEAGQEVRALAKRRLQEQDSANERTPAPILSRDELDGYPREFWPYLRRLKSGLIGMTAESCVTRPDILDLYRIWEKQNKPDDSFIPDPRVMSFPIWELIPVEFRPYLHYDETFGKPSVRFDHRNEYEKAMISKAVAWNNQLMMEAFQAMEAANRNEAEGPARET